MKRKEALLNTGDASQLVPKVNTRNLECILQRCYTKIREYGKRKKGIKVTFGKSTLKEAHPNSAQIISRLA